MDAFDAYNDLSGLAPYLAEFAGFGAAPAAAAPRLDTGVTLSMQATQAALNLKGFKGKTGKPLVEDGKWGPNTQFALAAFVKANAKNYPGANATMASPSSIFILPTPFANILVGALQMTEKGRKLLGMQDAARPSAVTAPVARNAVQGGVIAPLPGKEVYTVRDAQTVLRALGANIAVDNTLGPATKDAWAWAAMRANLPGFMDEIAGDPYKVFVDANTAATLRVKARNTRNPKMLSIAQVRAELKRGPQRPAAPKPVAAKPAPAPKPAMQPPKSLAAAAKSTAPSRSGLVDTSVGAAQEVLIRLGAKIKRDGSYGPGTATAWRAAATARKLRPEFDRGGPLNAWVDPQTLAALTAAAGQKVKPAAAPPPSAQKATVDGKPTAPSRAGLTQVSVSVAQTLLNKLGAKLKVDGAFGTVTKAAWATQAKSRGVKPEFDRAGPNIAWVDPAAYAVIEKAAGGGVPTAAISAPAAQPSVTTGTAQTLAADAVVKQATTTLLVKTLQQAMMMANVQGSLAGQFSGVTDDGIWGPTTERGFYTLFAIAAPYNAVWAQALPKLVAKSKKTVRVLPQQAQNAGELSKLWLVRGAKSPTTGVVLAPTPAEVQSPLATSAVARATTLVPVISLQKAMAELFYKQQAGEIPKEPVLPGINVTGTWNPVTDAAALWFAWGDNIFGGQQPSMTDQADFLNQVLVSNAALNGLRGLRGLAGYGGFGATPVGAMGANAIRLPAEVAQQVANLAAQYEQRMAPSPQAPPADSPPPIQGDTQYIEGQAPAIYNPSPQPSEAQLPPAPIPLTPSPPMFPQQEMLPSAGPAPLPVLDQPAADPSLAPEGAAALAPVPQAAPSSSGGGIGLVLGIIAVGTLAVIAMNKKAGGAPAKGKGF